MESLYAIQTNVYPSTQRRKLKRFGESIRRAIVIVPTDEEFKKRVAKREAEEGKDVPNEAVLKMKGTDKTYENHFFLLPFFYLPTF